MSTLPNYDLLNWEIPVKPSVLRNSAEFRAQRDQSREILRELTGVDYMSDDFAAAVEAVGSLHGSEHFDEAVKWLLGGRYWHLASQPLEVQRALPSWFWEQSLVLLNSASRFEALIYVEADSFEGAIERWADKSEGVPLATINFYRKKRSDEWAMIPEATFLKLYAA